MELSEEEKKSMQGAAAAREQDSIAFAKAMKQFHSQSYQLNTKQMTEA